MNETKADPHVLEMRRQLVEARRAARGVKESARNLRIIPKSERLSAATDAVMQDYDSRNPQPPPEEETTRRVR
jgi:hypothetical protein